MEEQGEPLNGSEDENDRTQPKRPTKIRDLFTDRVVGIISGALVPLVLLFIPLVDKYLDNSKAIQTLQIENNTQDIQIAKERLVILTDALINSQMQLKSVMEKLLTANKSLEACQESLKKRGGT